MIEIKELTQADIGKDVVYENRTQDGTLIVREKGKISSWNAHYIFVRFSGDTAGGKACRQDSLYWAMLYETFVYDPNERATMKDDYHPKKTRPIKIKA